MANIRVQVVHQQQSSSSRSSSSNNNNKSNNKSKTTTPTKVTTTRTSRTSRKSSSSPAKATAAALENIIADDSIHSISTQSTPEPVAPDSNGNGNILAQTVMDLSEVAKESYAGLKEWASRSSPVRNSSSSSGSIGSSSKNNSSSRSSKNSNNSSGTTRQQQQQTTTTSRTSSTTPASPIYSEQQPWYQTIVNSASSDPNIDVQQQRDAAKKAIQDLMSPFMACHHGGGSSTIYGSNTDDPFDLSNHDTPYYYNYNDHSRNRLQDDLYQLKERVFMLSQADSVVSMDTAAEDEMMQLQRLTSWGTNGTNNSNQSDALSYVTDGGDTAALDDDGRVIPQVLLDTAQKRRQARRRKRIVRFDYPPISSLRECPRPDPNDLPDLFFTEEELDEIEADRSSTIIADDIEIVAVGSQTNADAPKLQRKPRSSSPHPQRPAKGSWSCDQSTASSSSSKKSSPKKDDPRLIKGVQIYLRERSTGTKGSR